MFCGPDQIARCSFQSFTLVSMISKPLEQLCGMARFCPSNNDNTPLDRSCPCLLLSRCNKGQHTTRPSHVHTEKPPQNGKGEQNPNMAQYQFHPYNPHKLHYSAKLLDRTILVARSSRINGKMLIQHLPDRFCSSSFCDDDDEQHGGET